MEFKVRRVAKDKYDLVLMQHDDVRVMHDLSTIGVQDFLRTFFGSQLASMPVGTSINNKFNQQKF